jgi:predicted  nucleic acid-binding Zn-ribbon protein
MTISESAKEAAKKIGRDLHVRFGYHFVADATIVLDIQNAIDTTTADLRKQLANAQAENERLNTTLSRVACHATDGLLAQTGYDAETYIKHIDAAITKAEEKYAEKIFTENERLRRTLDAAATSAAAFVHEAAKLAESDERFPRIDTVLAALKAIREAQDGAGGEG